MILPNLVNDEDYLLIIDYNTCGREACTVTLRELGPINITHVPITTSVNIHKPTFVVYQVMSGVCNQES